MAQYATEMCGVVTVIHRESDVTSRGYIRHAHSPSPYCWAFSR